MSAVIERFIICDGCGENFGVDNRWKTISAHRQEAARNGWRLVGNKDYCPTCKSKSKTLKPE
jgi:hypothetical protein